MKLCCIGPGCPYHSRCVSVCCCGCLLVRLSFRSIVALGCRRSVRIVAGWSVSVCVSHGWSCCLLSLLFRMVSMASGCSVVFGAVLGCR